MGGIPAASLVYVAAAFFGLLGRGGAVNVDLGSTITYAGPGGSDFGFAVSLLANRTAAYVLAGAPKGAPPVAQNGSSFGALYRCAAKEAAAVSSGAAKAAVGACSSLPVDVSGIGKAFDGASRSNQPVETKAGQLLGMAIASAPSGAVIACAPHYLFNGQSGTMATRRRDPTGNCFLTPDVGRYDFTEYSPCRRQLELYMASPDWGPGLHDNYVSAQPSEAVWVKTKRIV